MVTLKSAVFDIQKVTKVRLRVGRTKSVVYRSTLHSESFTGSVNGFRLASNVCQANLARSLHLETLSAKPPFADAPSTLLNPLVPDT